MFLPFRFVSFFAGFIHVSCLASFIYSGSTLRFYLNQKCITNKIIIIVLIVLLLLLLCWRRTGLWTVLLSWEHGTKVKHVEVLSFFVGAVFRVSTKKINNKTIFIVIWNFLIQRSQIYIWDGFMREEELDEEEEEAVCPDLECEGWWFAWCQLSYMK